VYFAKAVLFVLTTSLPAFKDSIIILAGSHLRKAQQSNLSQCFLLYL
jgi:hypothetical protein